MSAPRRLALPNELGYLSTENKTAEIRFTNGNGETEVWMVSAGDPRTMVDRDDILMAYIDAGVDLQKGLQTEHINRLLKHLEWHHEHMSSIQTVRVLGTDVCWYGHREAEGLAQR
jgi:DNA-binding response OmpR family regulator